MEPRSTIAAAKHGAGAWKLLSLPHALYLPLIPITILGFLGITFLHGGYQTPEEIPFWTFLFGLPHIIASFQTTMDEEYLRRYRGHAAMTLGIILLPNALIELGVSPGLILMIFAALTVHHVIAQQFGVSLGVERMRPGIFFNICKWSIISLGVIAYFQSYFAYELQDRVLFVQLTGLAEAALVPTGLLIVVSAALTIGKARDLRLRGHFFLINVALLLLALILIFKTPYALVGLMLVRVLHDSTSFVIYVLHDNRRNQGRRRNFLYRLFPFLPVMLLGPLLALFIAGVLSHASSYNFMIGWLVVGVTLGHYYIEKFMWKSGTPHRENFSFS